MCIDDAENLHFRYSFPIQSTIGFAWNLSVAGQQQHATGMLDIHRNLSDPVPCQLVSAQLWQTAKRFQIFRRHQVGQPLADPPAIVRPVLANDGLLVRQIFGELRVNK